ncbi:MAG: PDZ domain-containing protein [Bdellovibrionota bacterium]|nr:PDZ domain-containing protein [Bdellovibrionota bacterium]
MKNLEWLKKLKEKLSKKKAQDGDIEAATSDAAGIPSAPKALDKNPFKRKAGHDDKAYEVNPLSEILTSDKNVEVNKIARSINRPPLEDYYIYVLGALIGFAGADLTTTGIRPYLSSDPIKLNQGVSTRDFAEQKSSSDYDVIVSRNIFDAEGRIPEASNQKDTKEEEVDLDGPATPSRLPITLLGTIVHYNPAKSVASLEVRAGQTKALPYIPNDNIEGIATLMKVERTKVFFKNLSNQRLEYIEMQIDGNLTFGKKASAETEEVATGIKKDGNSFEVSKEELKKQLANLPELLQQAQARPFTDPYTGEMSGFQIVNIKAGSIFEKLLERGDVIKEVNGQKVNSAAKAMQMYRTLKDSNDIKLTVERNGRNEVLDFTVK